MSLGLYTRREVFFSRLAILIASISAPIYFSVLLYFIPFQIDISIPNTIPYASLLMRYILAPLVLAFPWLALIYLYRYKLANSLINLWDNTILIPLKWRIFYGFNAVIISLFFVIPFATPAIALIAAIFLAGRLIARIRYPERDGSVGPWIGFIMLALLFAVAPIYFVIKLIPVYTLIINAIIALWFSNISIIALLAMWIANALSIGSLMEFVAVFRIHHQIDTYGYKLSEVPHLLISTMEILIFASLASIYIMYPSNRDTIFFYVNLGSLVIVSLIFLIGFITGVKTKENRKTLTGLFVAALFVGIYVFQNINPNAITVVMILAFIIFLIVFLFSFSQAENS